MKNCFKRGFIGATLAALIMFGVQGVINAVHEPDINEIEIKVLECSE